MFFLSLVPLAASAKLGRTSANNPYLTLPFKHFECIAAVQTLGTFRISDFCFRFIIREDVEPEDIHHCWCGDHDGHPAPHSGGHLGQIKGKERDLQSLGSSGLQT